MLTEIERSAHHSTAIAGDTPTAGPRDLGDQAVSVEAAKGTADLGALLSGIVPAGSRDEPSIEAVRGCRGW